MRLNSVRDLKAKLRPTLIDEDVRSGSDLPVTLGIAPGDGEEDYRLAVRSTTELPQALIDRLRREARHEIDIRTTGIIAAELPITGARPTRELRIGSSIAHYRCSAGTLGFFARRVSDGAIGVVSNNHVLAANDGGAAGEEVLSPAPADGGRRPHDVVANLDGNYPRLSAKEVSVDCAFAPLVRHVQYDARSLGQRLHLDPSPAPLEKQRRVAKIGRTTGRTEGIMTAFELDAVPIYYGDRLVRFNGQIEVDTVDMKPFSKKGDSGSLVFVPDGRPVGLLYAMAPVGGSHGRGLAYANVIDTVLSTLGVTFVS